MKPLPLQGIKVLDFTTLLPGPLATLMLAEAGAEVTKIERPEGDDMRSYPPRVGGISAPFAMLNAGKRCIGLDLKNAEAREMLRPMIAEADILVEQFRPGVMARLGLGYDALRKINPRLIYCSISGYGQTGPRAGEAGHDLNYQAVTGLLSLSPGTRESPTVPPALSADIAGGSFPAVMNILLALRQRDLTGEGCHIDIAMADAMFTFAWLALATAAGTGRLPKARELPLNGSGPRYQLYATSDGRFLAVGALEQKFWLAFCEALDLPAALRDDRKDPIATMAEIRRRIILKPASHWAEHLARFDCCATIVADLDEALADPHFLARGLFKRRVATPDGLEMGAAILPIHEGFRRPPQEARPVEAISPLKSPAPDA